MVTGASDDDVVDPLRPSDADRAAVVAGLREALGADRLSLEAFERRVTAVYAARTLDELQRVSEDLPVPGGGPSAAPRRWRGALAAVAAVAVGVGVVIAWPADDEAPPATESTESTDIDAPDTVDPASIEARAEAEGWFDGCAASDTGLAALEPAAGDFDRLADVVPDGTIEQYAVGAQSPLAVDHPNLRPWIAAALAASDAREGFAGTFNAGPPGPGGWTVYAFRFDDPSDASRAAEQAYTAFVCQFGAEPWDAPVDGAVAAYTPADAAQVFRVVGSTMIVTDWSMYQEVDEALRRAGNVAQIVAAEADRAST